LWLSDARGFSLSIGGFSTLNPGVSIFDLIFAFHFSLSISNRVPKIHNPALQADPIQASLLLYFSHNPTKRTRISKIFAAARLALILSIFSLKLIIVPSYWLPTRRSSIGRVNCWNQKNVLGFQICVDDAELAVKVINADQDRSTDFLHPAQANALVPVVPYQPEQVFMPK
jgi:hypothetical protein